MVTLTSAQRQDVYQREAARAGIHSALLAALDVVHHQPHLLDGETGLGLAPVPGLAVAQMNTFAAQVYYAANTIRSLTDTLTVAGWAATDLWDPQQQRYTDRFVQEVAKGYVPPVTDALAAQLEPVEAQQLLGAYLTSLPAHSQGLTAEWRSLEDALLAAVEQLPRYYGGLGYQREALLEMVRGWRKLETTAAALESLEAEAPPLLLPETLSPAEAWLERALALVRQVRSRYQGYPYQREALWGLVQQWYQLPGRAAAIAKVSQAQGSSGDRHSLDAALMARVQTVVAHYEGYGEQRLALTETFQRWYGLGSRTEALAYLGIQPAELNSEATDPVLIEQAAAQVDRALLRFLDQVPRTYQGTEPQRQALLHLTQQWGHYASQDVVVQALFKDLQRLERAQREAQDAPPPPLIACLPDRPATWSAKALQQDPALLWLTIAPQGQFTWADATRGGQFLPPNQAAVEAIVRMATAAQWACDRLHRSLTITEWYQPEGTLPMNLNPYHRHALGDAIAGFVSGCTANQIYWALDPWWPGGLARCVTWPHYIYLDLRPQRARWEWGHDSP